MHQKYKSQQIQLCIVLTQPLALQQFMYQATHQQTSRRQDQWKGECLEQKENAVWVILRGLRRDMTIRQTACAFDFYISGEVPSCNKLQWVYNNDDDDNYFNIYGTRKYMALHPFRCFSCLYSNGTFSLLWHYQARKSYSGRWLFV